MIIILLVISIFLIVIGSIINRNSYDSGDGIWITGVFGTVLFMIVALIIGVMVTSGMTIDDKITLYETENNKIDKQICSIVENYKDYEKSSFNSITDKDANTLISLYPELKADNIVKQQIKIYNSNRKEIIKFKEEKLNLKPLRWWLYFGG